MDAFLSWFNAKPLPFPLIKAAIDNTRVNERQRKVINNLLDGFEGFLTTSKYARMTKCSNDTALRDIRELLARGILLKNEGGGRSVSYRLGTPESID